MKATLTVSVDVTNGDELLSTLRVLEQLANPIAVDPPAAVSSSKVVDSVVSLVERAKPKTKRKRRTKAEIAADKADAALASAPHDPVAQAQHHPEVESQYTVDKDTTPTTPTITDDKLKGAVRKRIESHGLDSVKSIFEEYGNGAQKLSAIPGGCYPAVYAALTKSVEEETA